MLNLPPATEAIEATESMAGFSSNFANYKWNCLTSLSYRQTCTEEFSATMLPPSQWEYSLWSLLPSIHSQRVCLALAAAAWNWLRASLVQSTPSRLLYRDSTLHPRHQLFCHHRQRLEDRRQLHTWPSEKETHLVSNRRRDQNTSMSRSDVRQDSQEQSLTPEAGRIHRTASPSRAVLGGQAQAITTPCPSRRT